VVITGLKAMEERRRIIEDTLSIVMKLLRRLCRTFYSGGHEGIWGEMGTFEFDRHPSLSLMMHGCSEGGMIPQSASKKNCGKTVSKTTGAVP
jgi:hypothetical protein